MITQEKFELILNNHPVVRDALEKSLPDLYNENLLPTAGFLSKTQINIFAMIVASILFFQIGLPWLVTARNVSDLKRNEIEEWINQQYKEQGIDPIKAREAAEKVRKELEPIQDETTQKMWESLQKMMLEE